MVGSRGGEIQGGSRGSRGQGVGEGLGLVESQEVGILGVVVI